MRSILVLALVMPAPASPEVLLPVRAIRAQTLVSAADFRIDPADLPGAFPTSAAVDGLEARTALYPGRVVRAGDLGPPAIVGRNEIVTLVYARGGLRIATEGRALGRGGIGDSIKVMNLSSRMTVMGTIADNGTVEVR